MKTTLLVGSAFLYGLAFGGTPPVQEHEGPATGTERAVDESARTASLDKSARYLPCSETGEATGNTPLGLAPNRLVRALILSGEDKSWKLATPKDVEDGFVQCSTVIADEHGQAVGRYRPTFKRQFGCDSEPFVATVPGGLIYPDSPARETIRYFPIRPPGAPEGSEIFDWVPTPCGMQNESALLAMQNAKGAEEVISFESKEGRDWTAAKSKHIDGMAERLLLAQSVTSGPFAEASRLCLAKRAQAKKAPGEAVHEAPKPALSPPQPQRAAPEIVAPFSPPAVNSDGDQPAPPEFWGD